jgi:hypothetical protein
MRTHVFAVALAASCLPVCAYAQGGGYPRAGGTVTPDPSAVSSNVRAPKTPTVRDLSDMNPATLLIGKRKKLSLADSQVTRLKAVEKTITDRNAQFMTQYDSIHKWTVPLVAASSNASSQPGFSDADRQRAAPTSSPAEQAQMQASLRDLRGLLADFRERHKADDADALNAVPDAQKKAAADFLTQQDGDLDKMISTASGRP